MGHFTLLASSDALVGGLFVLFIVVLVVSAMTFGILGAVICHAKGDSGTGFFWGAILGPAGLIIGYLVAGRPCNHCKSRIHPQAKVCPRCHHDDPLGQAASLKQMAQETHEWKLRKQALSLKQQEESARRAAAKGVKQETSAEARRQAAGVTCKYEAQGIDPKSGYATTLVVDAVSPFQARALAAAAGMDVDIVRRVGTPPAPTRWQLFVRRRGLPALSLAAYGAAVIAVLFVGAGVAWFAYTLVRVEPLSQADVSTPVSTVAVEQEP